MKIYFLSPVLLCWNRLTGFEAQCYRARATETGRIDSNPGRDSKILRRLENFTEDLKNFTCGLSNFVHGGNEWV